MNSKVEEDLAKSELKEALGLASNDKETKEKLEEFKQKAISERFSMLISSLIGTISVTQKLDSSNYEDIARRLMGSHAYLLFLFDKLVATVSRSHALTYIADSQAHSCVEKCRGKLEKSKTFQVVHESQSAERALVPDPVPDSDAIPEQLLGHVHSYLVQQEVRYHVRPLVQPKPLPRHNDQSAPGWQPLSGILNFQ